VTGKASGRKILQCRIARFPVGVGDVEEIDTEEIDTEQIALRSRPPSALCVTAPRVRRERSHDG
jgi:hypothetical protein